MQTMTVSQEIGKAQHWSLHDRVDFASPPFISGYSVAGDFYHGITLTVDSMLSTREQLEVVTKFQGYINDWVAKLQKRADDQ